VVSSLQYDADRGAKMPLTSSPGTSSIEGIHAVSAMVTKGLNRDRIDPLQPSYSDAPLAWHPVDSAAREPVLSGKIKQVAGALHHHRCQYASPSVTDLIKAPTSPCD
jgi:hypothetical protein